MRKMMMILGVPILAVGILFMDVAWGQEYSLPPGVRTGRKLELSYHGTGRASFSALKVGQGARASGMGNAYTAVADDVNAIYWNEAGLTNVETHVASAYDLPVDDGTVDRAFLITVLPEIPDPVRGLREVYRVLKPGGIVSTTEEFLDPDYPRRKTTIAWAEAAGLERAEHYGNWWTYTINFRKPA